MKGVAFLTTGDGFWEDWGRSVLEMAIGTVLLLLAAGVVTGGKLLEYVKFEPSGPLEEVQWWCTRVMLLWGTVSAAMLIPTYAAGANFYGE